MTDSTIGVAEPGTPTKLLQSYQNTVSGQSVQAEGIVQVDLSGVPVPTGTASSLIHVTLDQWIGSTAPTIGQKTKANSLPVTLASDQGNVSVTGTVTANQGTANTIVNGWPVKLTDGTLTTQLTNIGSLQGLGFAGPAVYQGDVTWIITPSTGSGIGVQVNNNSSNLAWLGTSENTIPSVGGSTPGVVLPALANATAPSKTEGAYVALSTDLSGNLRTSLNSIPNPPNLPKLSLNPQGSLQVNDRRLEERLTMLAEMAALNSIIASDNGPGARNYQELR
jgi:hypothetical protein